MTPGLMDVDTSEAIGRLGERIDALEVSLGTEIREGLAETRIELRAEFREGLAESRRHTEVLFESLRDDIRILAEGFAVLSTKLESLQR
jgi:hypothetical protein